MAKVTLADLADASVLGNVWRKSLRKSLRKPGLKDLHLAHDPLDWAAFDWDLQRTIAVLSAEIASATYRPAAPVTVRGAKTVGLTRPLAYLATRDQLAYKAIVARAEN